MIVENMLYQAVLDDIKNTYGEQSLEYGLFRCMTLEKFVSIVDTRDELINDLNEFKEIVEDVLCSNMTRTNEIFEKILNAINEVLDSDLEYSNFFNIEYQVKIDKAIHIARLTKACLDIAVAVTEDIYEYYDLD